MGSSHHFVATNKNQFSVVFLVLEKRQRFWKEKKKEEVKSTAPLHYFAQHFKMYKDQSDEKEEGGYVTTQVCKATKAELKDAGCKVIDACPLCLDSGVHVRVGNHCSGQPTGSR